MDPLLKLLILMMVAITLIAFAIRFKFPYPLALIIGGAFLGFTPGISEIPFDPAFILVIVLPPILFYAAYSISFKEFKKNLYEIISLALGLVIATTVAIALVVKWLFPEWPWAYAFIFGAIISPPDAVAASAILKRFKISPKLVAILEGESLINDASGLILYRLALFAILSGSFSFTQAGYEFLTVVAGGILIGALTGYIFQYFTAKYFDPIVAVVFSFTIPYFTYLLADAIGASGVLAVVINGLIGSWAFMTRFTSATRIMGWASWDIFILLLNCFIFTLIGFELRGVIQRITLEQGLTYFGYSILLFIVMVLVRFAYVYLRKGYILYTCSEDDRKIVLKETVITSWASMRGIVSMALALALPYTLPDGSSFIGRDEMVFLTFSTILLTLAITGLTLPSVIKKMHLRVTHNYNTRAVRDELLKVAKEHLDDFEEKGKLSKDERKFLTDYFALRHHLLELSSKEKESPIVKARNKILNKKKERLLDLWRKNMIEDELFQKMEREIDVEEHHSIRGEI